MELIQINTSEFYPFCIGRSAVWFDGQTVYDNRSETRVEDSDYYRWTGRFEWENTPAVNTFDLAGDPIDPAIIPEIVMAYIRQQWQEYQDEQARERERAEQERAARQAQESRQRNASEQITIGGVTQPRWSWRQGWSIPNAPTEADLAIIRENGWDCEQQSNGTWYISDPAAFACME